MWLPWGARLTRHSGAYRLLSTRSGSLGSGEVVDTDRLADRFPPRGESIARTARRWLGAPYLWGGVTPSGVDCSGLVQSVLWMHGIAAPRDSDQQQCLGVPVQTGQGFEDARAGDLLFFAERGTRITHVAISLGGPLILHAGVSNGGVAVNDVTGSAELEDRLRQTFVAARRVVSDAG
jgi:cell wall-associated NlpC family hydrolase